MIGDPVNQIDIDGMLSFNFNQFANDVRENRSSTATNLAALGATLAVGTMSKTKEELRGFGPKEKLNPYTNQMSRWSGRLNRITNGKTGRLLREFGRSASGRLVGGLATAALIADGFYNWVVIIKAAIDATCFD